MLFSKTTKVVLQITSLSSLMILTACQDGNINSGSFTGSNETKDNIENSRGSVNSATYQMTFESSWSATTHPTNIPSNIQFSKLIGAALNRNITLWQTGDKASRGIELLARLKQES